MRKTILVLMIGVLMFGLFGCAGSRKYQVDYDGQKAFYAGAKDSYKAGQTVHLEYGPIATDTNYCFEINTDSYSCRGMGDSFVIEFVMPEHDVSIKCQRQNATANEGD